MMMRVEYKRMTVIRKNKSPNIDAIQTNSYIWDDTTNSIIDNSITVVFK
jgi:hypothetical protein